MIDYHLPETAYHARNELSSTGARRILDSPARFRYWADNPQPPKPAFDVGHAAHAKILGVGASIVEYPPEHLTPSGAVSTKAATVAWEQEQRANGLVPISPRDARNVDAMAEAVLAHPEARHILETITGREVSIITDVDGVPCRARFDLYDGTRAADLKTSRDASPRFRFSAGSYGYHIQEQWYRDVHAAETGHDLESFDFIVVETAAPHLVGIYVLDYLWGDRAKEKTEKARRLYRECTESGEWPGYTKVTLSPPPSVIYDDDEEEAFTF